MPTVRNACRRDRRCRPPSGCWTRPDSLAAQSHRNPDGAGIGVFDADGRPRVDKQPLAAWRRPRVRDGARELPGTTFVAHVRYASTGALTAVNTHPFEQDGRLFAHNGVVEGLDELDEQLAELGVAGLVHGETDSERLFALITGEITRHRGDVRAGVRRRLDWAVAQLPIYASISSWSPRRAVGAAVPRDQ